MFFAILYSSAIELRNSPNFPFACLCSLIHKKSLRQRTWSRTALHIIVCSLYHTYVTWTSFPHTYINIFIRRRHSSHHVLRASLLLPQITAANVYPVKPIRNSPNISRSLTTIFITVTRAKYLNLIYSTEWSSSWETNRFPTSQEIPFVSWKPKERFLQEHVTFHFIEDWCMTAPRNEWIFDCQKCKNEIWFSHLGYLMKS